jgi:AcrR family transcriptional regulator
VGRHKQPGIRDRILDDCVDHALTHGLPDRLEPLAAASGTSKRMLIYHFGTRDALLRETLGRARRRLLPAIEDIGTPGGMRVRDPRVALRNHE